MHDVLGGSARGLKSKNGGIKIQAICLICQSVFRKSAKIRPQSNQVEIGGAKIKAFVFVATLGHSRRLHVRAFRAEKQEHWFAGLESAFTTFGGYRKKC